MVDKKVRIEKGELYFLPILSVLEIRCTICKIFYLFEIDHEKKNHPQNQNHTTNSYCTRLSYQNGHDKIWLIQILCKACVNEYVRLCVCMYVHLFTSRKVTLCQGNNLSLKKLNN